MSDDPSTANLDERVGRLETGQQTLTEKLDQVLAAVTRRPGKDDDPAPGPSGRPGSIAEQVQAELARAKQEAAAAEAAEAEKSDREQIKEQLAKLKEAPPVQPQRRSERVMWGAR